MGVSRVTVRRALRQLTEEGVIDGRRVTSMGEPTNSLLSFTSMAAERGLVASAQVLECAVRGASLDQADSLRIAPGAPVFILRRVRFLGGFPIALDQSQIEYSRVADIERIDFTTASLYDVLVSRYSIVPTRTDYAIEASGATAAEAALLQLEVGAPVLRAAEIMYDQHDQPTDIGQIAYRGDRYRFRTTLKRQS